MRSVLATGSQHTWLGPNIAGCGIYAAVMIQRLLLVMLAGAVAALTPAALASPPDEHWLGGLYDDADYDDVVLAVVESAASLEPQLRHAQQCGQAVVASAPPIDERLHATPTLSPNHTRAPPAS